MELSLSIGGGGDPFWSHQRYGGTDHEEIKGSGSPSKNGTPVRLDLKLSWSTDTAGDGGAKSPYSDKCSSGGMDLDVNEIPLQSGSFKHSEMGSSSSDSRPGDVRKRGDCDIDVERGFSRCSDEEEGGGSTASTRKKLRLSKEQSSYLEESFKEHPTLNPKQKVALAKRLNLQPRQVEVWFQNRRARTKLKQTEVDCEYLRRCCETLTEENRKLQRELQDLKALKSPHNPFLLRGPPTMLSMCPSCELHSSTTTTSGKATGTFGVGVPKTRLFPFAQRTSAAS